MQGGRSFDFWCKSRKLAGAGRFRLDGDSLTLEWTNLTANDRAEKPPNRPFTAKLRGPGNVISLAPADGGPPLNWRRAPL